MEFSAGKSQHAQQYCKDGKLWVFCYKFICGLTQRNCPRGLWEAQDICGKRLIFIKVIMPIITYILLSTLHISTHLMPATIYILQNHPENGSVLPRKYQRCNLPKVTELKWVCFLSQGSHTLNESWQYLLWEEKYKDTNDDSNQYLHIYYVHNTMVRDVDTLSHWLSSVSPQHWLCLHAHHIQRPRQRVACLSSWLPAGMLAITAVLWPLIARAHWQKWFFVHC